MKPAYSNISLTTGANRSGICEIKLVPREWLQQPIVPDFNTRIVYGEILLQPDRAWITLELAPETYDFEEKPKSSKGGSYFETSASGNLNDITPENLAVLETLRNHEFVCVLKDRQRRLRVVGNADAGLIFRAGNKIENKNGGQQIGAVDLSMETEFFAPFYEP